MIMKLYDRFWRLDLDVEGLDTLLRFFGLDFGGDAGASASESASPNPAAAKKSSTRSSSPASLIVSRTVLKVNRVKTTIAGESSKGRD